MSKPYGNGYFLNVRINLSYCLSIINKARPDMASYFK